MYNEGYADGGVGSASSCTTVVDLNFTLYILHYTLMRTFAVYPFPCAATSSGVPTATT